MSEHRYFIQLSYKGTRYFGWQIQPNQISIQGEIERALTQLNSNRKVEIIGCGRTDTGVHASEYFAHFDSNNEINIIDVRYKLNSMLHADIAIQKIFKVKTDLHARFSAISRTYRYQIHTFKNPFNVDFSWLNSVELDLQKLADAAKIISAHSDFECFSKVHTDVTNFNCSIQNIEWKKIENGYIFTVSANRFLRNMVRAMTGTLLDVGTGKISLNEFEQILNSKNRSAAGTSVPAHGLTLVKVEYPFGSF